MPTVTTSRGTMSYSDSSSRDGTGPPVLLLHANLHDSSDYAPVLDALSDGRRVIAVDWPGHGNSPTPDTPLGAPELGDLAVELVDVLDLTNLVVIGNSVGGYAACRHRAGTARPGRGRRPGQHGRVHPAHAVQPRVLCGDGKSGRHPHVRPLLRAGLHAADVGGRPRHRLACRGPLQDSGRRTYGGGLVAQFHLTRSRFALRRPRHQGSGSDHLGHKGSHRTRTVGQGSREGDSRRALRHAARRTRGVLVETRAVAAGSAAVRGGSPACRSAHGPRLMRITGAAPSSTSVSARVRTFGKADVDVSNFGQRSAPGGKFLRLSTIGTISTGKAISDGGGQARRCAA